MEYIYDVFWAEKFWLSRNVTWKHMQQAGPPSGITIAQPRDLLWSLPLALVLIILRYVVEQLCFKPVAIGLGMKERKVIYPERNDTLAKAFKKCRRPEYSDIAKLASKLSWTPRRVERWFRIKRNLNKSSALQKFCEAGWRFGFYSFIFVFGVYVVHDEDFAFDFGRTVDLTKWPYYHTRKEFCAFFLLEMAFYISLIISLFRDVRRGDFFLQITHHSVTLLLMFGSWSINFVACGICVLVVHDVADLWLEVTKICQYAQYKKACDFFLVIFAVIWIVSRVFVYPIYILIPCYGAASENFARIGFAMHAIYALFCFLLTLYCLHLMWTYFLIKHVVIMFIEKDTSGKHDERSESEASELSSDGTDAHPDTSKKHD